VDHTGCTGPGRRGLIGVLAKALPVSSPHPWCLASFLWQLIPPLAAVFLVWSGRFEYLKRSMTILVTVVIIGVGYVAFARSRP